MKIKRNDICSCGSGKKYKKCCLIQQSTEHPKQWVDNDGIHIVAPGTPPSSEDLAKITKEYQAQIRNSPLWNGMVQKYGKEEAKRLLKEFKVESR
jgi:hypothetical protein